MTEGMTCRRCGQSADATAAYCAGCGASLSSAASSAPLVETFIPYKNSPALVGYYLGVFSLVPCFGLALVPFAIGCGIFGLRRAAKHPEARGKAHAWTAILLPLGATLIQAVGFAYIVNR